METGDIVAIVIVGSALFAGCMGWLKWLSDIKTGLLVAFLALWLVCLMNSWGWFRQVTNGSLSTGVIVPYISRKLDLGPGPVPPPDKPSVVATGIPDK